MIIFTWAYQIGASVFTALTIDMSLTSVPTCEKYLHVKSKYSKQVRETPVRLAQETEATDLFKQLQSSNFVSVCEQKVA